MATWKQIEASREARLWIGQIIVPAVGLALAFPEARNWVKDRIEEVKWKARAWKENYKKRKSS